MENTYLPTKTNLIKIKNTLRLSKQGQELLEKKKIILIKEKEKYIQKVLEIREKTKELFKQGYLLLQNASVDIGMEAISKIANGISKEKSIDIKYKTIMGVEIPSIIYQQEEKHSPLNYGFYTTTISLDKAVLKFNEIKKYMLELTELENTIHRLEKSIVKVQTRSNALKNIIIPQDELVANNIQNSLDEKEREDFARLKVVKKKIFSNPIL